VKPVLSTNHLLEEVLHIQKKLKNYFLFKREICKVFADFALITHLLFRNFSKQASTVVDSKTFTKVIPTMHIFRLFATSNLYLRTTTPICVKTMPQPIRFGSIP